jgi:hypothetical protein
VYEKRESNMKKLILLTIILLLSCNKNSTNGDELVTLFSDWGTFQGGQPQDTVEIVYPAAPRLNVLGSKDTVIVIPY